MLSDIYAGFLSYIHIGHRHILSLQSSFMASSFRCPTRDHNSATLLGHFFSVTLFSRYCFRFKWSWFLDSLTIFLLGGHQNQVTRDVQQIIEVGVRMGLSLNVNRCEVVADPATTTKVPLLQSFERIAPLFRCRNLDSAWAERCADLSKAVSRLSLISSPTAVFDINK